MRTIYKPRQGGKTYDLIKRSAETGYPIVTKDVNSGKLILKRAKEMGLTIPKPISVVSMCNGNKIDYDGKYLLIDDADVLLEYIIRRKLGGYHVDTIALVQRNDKGHEIDIFGDDIIEKYSM